MAADEPSESKDFIRTLIDRHLEEGRYDEVVTRFPPEPNGYLHIGHAKSIVLNFGIAEEYGGRCFLRFDDTNPLTEEEIYARSMQEDIRWLGYEWDDLRHAADYFEQLFGHAVTLVEKGKAYVDSQTEEEIRENRGSVTAPGTPSPYRERSVEENLDLFRRMRAGEFEDGAHVLRARIDMAHPNMIMRDPVLYRIRHADHYRAEGDWCIYPLYDFAHCLEDAIEEITHSLCTLEFDNNREIYDWLLDELGYEEPRPHQYEFARLELEHMVLSKRKLIRLVKEGYVDGWDDPRLPTLAGMRRRGIPPESIVALCEMVGVTKTESRVDVGKLEYTVRDRLNRTAPRRLAVLKPLRVTITNYPEGDGGDGAVEWLDAPSYPRDIPLEGSRKVPFSKHLLIERDDFAESPPEGWRRLAPGWEVRLRNAYTLRCDEVVKGDDGEPVELRCTYDPETLGSNPDRPVKGVIHWLSAEHALPATVRLYDRLFHAADPGDVPEGEDFTYHLNPDSLVELEDARVEPSVADDSPGLRYQFERTGYFWRDPVDSSEDALVFNRIESMRDSWAREREEALAGKEPAGGGSGEPSAGAAGAGGGAPGGGARGGTGEETAAEDGETAKGRSGEAATVGRPADQAPATPEDRISDERREARSDDSELAARFHRYQDDLDLDLDDADILTGSRPVSDLFEAALAGYAAGGGDAGQAGDAGAEPGAGAEGDFDIGGSTVEAAGSVASWVVNEVMRELKDASVEELPFQGEALGRLARMVDDGRISRRVAKDVFEEMVADGTDPETVVERDGLEKVSDPSVLEPLVDTLVERHADKVVEYRGGKTGLLGFFVGQVMRETGGTADPELTRDLLLERLEG